MTAREIFVEFVATPAGQVFDPCRFARFDVYRNAADFNAHLPSSHFESFTKAALDLFGSQSVRRLDLKNYATAPREATLFQGGPA